MRIPVLYTAPKTIFFQKIDSHLFLISLNLTRVWSRLKTSHSFLFSGAKTPSDVIRFQNYHHCFAVLSSLRIEALANERKETKKLYQSCMESYAALFLGRPLEQIAIFFDGVTKEIDQERPAEEIQFMAMYNKSSLRKVIKEYPGKKVKKGLEELYLKVEKHTAEDDNRLLQVVWREMQEEFIRQYNHYDK